MDGVVRIFDTTLRDGEQSPGASMTADEKVEVATQLDRLGVDVIEAGFPAASPGDLEAVARVSGIVRDCAVAGLARCSRSDIDASWEAVRGARHPVIHVFIATSDIHLRHKLRTSRPVVLDRVAEMVRYARSRCAEVEFSAEDATRSDWEYLASVAETAVRAGAATINLPDTVGYTTPNEYASMFEFVRDRVDDTSVTFSAHCHDDLGLATANTLAAVSAGARQVEVAVNGLGERAGNAALEEVVMALLTRRDIYGHHPTAVNTRELLNTSHLVSRITGLQVQVNKAVVGSNAFAHEAGIHQDGFLKERSTYEIMQPGDIGWEGSRLVLGKHSGRHGLAYRLQQLGYALDSETLDEVYQRFIHLADRQRDVNDAMLTQLVESCTPPSTSAAAGFEPAAARGQLAS